MSPRFFQGLSLSGKMAGSSKENCFHVNVSMALTSTHSDRLSKEHKESLFQRQSVYDQRAFSIFLLLRFQTATILYPIGIGFRWMHIKPMENGSATFTVRCHVSLLLRIATTTMCVKDLFSSVPEWCSGPGQVSISNLGTEKFVIRIDFVSDKFSARLPKLGPENYTPLGQKLINHGRVVLLKRQQCCVPVSWGRKSFFPLLGRMEGKVLPENSFSCRWVSD